MQQPNAEPANRPILTRSRQDYGSPKRRMIATALAMYQEIHPGFAETLTGEQAALYYRLLEDLDEAALSAGLLEAARNCTRFPTIAEIRAYALRSTEAKLKLEADEALDDLDMLVSRWGVDRTPEWANGKLNRAPDVTGATGHALRAVGGWRAYASRTAEQDSYLRHEFRKAWLRYKAASAAEEPRSLSDSQADPTLIAEISNAAAHRSL